MGSTTSLISRARPRLLVATAAIVVVLGVMVGISSMSAPVAIADNTLVSSSPASNASVPASPTSIEFVFADPLGPKHTAGASCNGEPFPLGNPTVGADRLTVSVPVPDTMPRGTCTVVLTVSAEDSTPNGQFDITFTVTADPPVAVATEPTVAVSIDPATTVDPAVATAAPAASPAASSATATDDTDAPKVGGPLGLSRVLATLGLAALLGALVLIVTAWPEGVEYILTVRFLRSAWVVSMVGSILTAIFLRAQLTGESVGSSIFPTSWSDLTDTTPGLAALARVAFTAACGWVVMRPERCLDPGSQVPALALPVLAVATFGLTRTGGDLAFVGVVAGVAHVVAMAVWLGGLILLSRVVLAGPGEDDLVHAVRGFSRISTPALLITVLTGAIQTWRLDGGTLFETGHGRVLLLKAVAVGTMVFVGLATRQFIRDRLRKVDSMTAPLASRLRRATGLEAAGGALVLVLSAWLVSMQPGGISVASGPDYGIETRLTVADLDLTVDLTGEIGRNGLRVEIASPTTGVTALVLTFIAPTGTSAANVQLTVPVELTGSEIGAAALDIVEGIPLDAAGVWTLQVDATTPAGPQSVQKNFTLVN